MSSLTSRKAAAGFAGGVLGIATLLFVLAALMIGFGPAGTGSIQVNQSGIGFG